MNTTNVSTAAIEEYRRITGLTDITRVKREILDHLTTARPIASERRDGAEEWRTGHVRVGDNPTTERLEIYVRGGEVVRVRSKGHSKAGNSTRHRRLI